MFGVSVYVREFVCVASLLCCCFAGPGLTRVCKDGHGHVRDGQTHIGGPTNTFPKGSMFIVQQKMIESPRGHQN